MADYFIEFAESYLVTPEQAKVANDIYCAINHVYTEYDGVLEAGDASDNAEDQKYLDTYRELSEDLQSAVVDYGVGFVFDIHEDDGKTYLYVAADEGSSVDTVLCFLSDVLEATDDHTIWTLTWSAGCSKQRSGEFGGGAAAISMTSIETKTTWTVAEELTEAMRAAQNRVL